MDSEELQEFNIQYVHEDGLHIVLSDGSSWDIPPGPSTKVVLWYAPQRITMENGKNGGYILTNLDTSGPDRVPAILGLAIPATRWRTMIDVRKRQNHGVSMR
jgi:hypothetical protein